MQLDANKTALISIIIPTHNRAHLICETLNSLLLQNYTLWECLIIDDGSTDGTEELVESYVAKDNRFMYLKRPVSHFKGPNGCRNYGYIRSKGEWILWLDSDDVLKVQSFNSQSTYFDNRYDAIVAPLEKWDDKLKKKLGKSIIVSQGNLIEDYFTGSISFYVSGPLWKRTFLEKQQYLFDENLSNLDDWDFNLRMLYQNPTIKYLEESFVKYRVHNESLAFEINKLNLKEIKSEFIAREKHLDLIKGNGKAQLEILNNFVVKRLKQLLLMALQFKSRSKYFLLKQLLKKQLYLHQIIGVLKTVSAFIIYTLFDRGYRWFK